MTWPRLLWLAVFAVLFGEVYLDDDAPPAPPSIEVETVELPSGDRLLCVTGEHVLACDFVGYLGRPE